MPEANSSKFLQQAYWRLDRLLAWIAYRGGGWSWRDWPPEVRGDLAAAKQADKDRLAAEAHERKIAEAYGRLMSLLERGEVRASRRIAKNGPRRPIEPYEWCDVELLRYGNPRFIGQEEWQFYDRRTPAQQHYAATAEPWIDVLFEVESALKAFPAAAPARTPAPAGTPGKKKKKQPAPPYSYKNLVLFFEKRRKLFSNRDDEILAAREHFDHKFQSRRATPHISKPALSGGRALSLKPRNPAAGFQSRTPRFPPEIRQNNSG